MPEFKMTIPESNSGNALNSKEQSIKQQATTIEMICQLLEELDRLHICDAYGPESKDAAYRLGRELHSELTARMRELNNTIYEPPFVDDIPF